MCVASPSAAAARGDAAQPVFHRKLSHYSEEIPVLRNQGIHYRPFVSDIASSHNGHKCQQNRCSTDGNTKSGWPSSVGAAMTRAVLRNPSVWAEWRLAGWKDRALTHWGRAFSPPPPRLLPPPPPPPGAILFKVDPLPRGLICRVAGWPWAPFVSQNSEWPPFWPLLFGRNGPFWEFRGRNFDAGARFRALFLV